jgi:two-component sensor histidine kinase
MNSLQFGSVSSLPEMQSRAADSDAAAQVSNAANRVSAVAQVHRNFYTEPTTGSRASALSGALR